MIAANHSERAHGRVAAFFDLDGTLCLSLIHISIFRKYYCFEAGPKISGLVAWDFAPAAAISTLATTGIFTGGKQEVSLHAW